MGRLLLVENQGSMIGGGQWSFLQLVRQLKDKWEIRCVCPADGELVAYLEEAGLEVEIVPMPAIRVGNAFDILKSIWRFVALIRGHRAELVHANGSRCMFYSGVAGWLARVPVTWHVRIAESDARWDRFLGALAKRVVVISGAVARRFDQTPVANKTELVYNGIDIGQLQAAESPNLKAELGLDGAIVGMVARITPEKDHRTFLEAARILAGAVGSIHFWIVGEAPDPDLLADLRCQTERSGLADRVLFLGARNDVAGIMKEMDVLVHCTHSEGFGRVIIEAMAVGTPVVASAVDGIPEIVTDRGLGRLVPEGDGKKVASAAREILEHENLRNDLINNGRTSVVERFSIVKHGEAMDRLFGRIVAGRR